jgi:carbon storage regulator
LVREQGGTMLVLSRKVGERILIGDNIAVTVVRVAEGVVRIGVEAPLEMPIVREEIRDQLKQDRPERKAAGRP